MGETFYIFKDGDLKRKDNNIIITTLEGEKKNLKAEVTEEIYLFGEVQMNTKLLNFLSQQKITMHIFNYYGFYSGSFYPRESNISGYLLVNQVKKYDDQEERVRIAKEILKSASYNIYRNLRYYNRRGIDLDNPVKEIESLMNKLDFGTDIHQLMGIEGNIRKIYYATWNSIIKQDICFEKRVKRPPDNMINSLISFVNSLIYTTVLSEIYKTQLNPTISFLHEPGSKRFSLSLDISEIFKPLIGERMIFSLLNKNQITEEDFEKESNFLYLKESGKKKILLEYDRRLKQTISHRDLGRQVSYRYLIRLECYKLIKDIIEEKKYSGFKIWW
ncbi:type I-B CRISPR-associated endonuclease Cas1b [Clostridium formicaceticum]|uniref:CRISPR-associated endonuclease Cas1 n=1 Tax=Clostridium formicaceticum TaxID=1497 RepID=A0AAC9RJ40_9CLOT|nr:type I-B CRISPR-associated endonuclease Cas1b [Clostridium formicaceticum]AOY77478.1 subtype I-B CRISPR-associated endonuclease Cas1 [Clostridium formicaceticum]ARE88041.1 CRISPR-associated endonuclease Cas1 [Clostridium formicaceticum]